LEKNPGFGRGIAVPLLKPRVSRLFVEGREMSASSFTLAVQVSWMVLCGMMLFSRFVFQATGPVWMRSFLDTWKFSVTHKVWGIAALLCGIAVAINTVVAWNRLGWLDRGLATVLALILSADGLLNLLPSWFGHFKERMQEAWVKRHRGTEKAGDKHLFGTVNFVLGLASAVVAALVYWHRPVPTRWLLVSVMIALVVMTILITSCQLEGRRTSDARRLTTG
jgi:hypothetical protein